MVFSQECSASADSATVNFAVRASENDWSRSELGPRAQWAPAIETVVSALLEADVPMAYCHGANYAIIYNDRFADMLGALHPHAWGQRVASVVPEIWTQSGLAELLDGVFGGGPAFHDDEEVLDGEEVLDDGEVLEQNGERPTGSGGAYFVRSCSAVRDSDGSVLGVVVVAAATASTSDKAGGAAQAEARGAKWRGIELWDQTVARPPLIWSGFNAWPKSSEAAAADFCPRLVAEGVAELIPPMSRPDGGDSNVHSGIETHVWDARTVSLAALFQPGETGTDACGDYYDGFSLPDGRIAVAIGDVMGGCGVAAAAVKERVRAGLRTAALASFDLNAIFTALDQLVGSPDLIWQGAPSNAQGPAYPCDTSFGGTLRVTALLGVFNPATGELLLASAGQLPPAVVRHQAAATTATSAQAGPGRLAEFAEVEPGPRLGIAGNRPVLRLVLEEGDALVAFTEGLLHRQEQGLKHGRASLLRTLSTMASTAPRSISQHVVDKLIGGDGLEHDGALLVVVRDSRVHHMASVLVSPQSSAVGGARRWVHAQLESWGLTEEVEAAAVLGVSELVTNVVLHAGTPARVSMELADRLLVTVEDTGMRGAVQPQAHVDNDSTGGRGLALVAAYSDAMGLSSGVRGSTVWFELVRDRVNA